METSAATIGFLVLAGAVTGTLGAILGTGGGVFLVPALVLLFKVPMHYAIGASIMSVIATSSAVASANVERETANMRLGMTLEIATSVGAIAGGLTAGWLHANVLEGIFAVVLIPAVVMMWRGASRDESAGKNTGGQAASATPSTGGQTSADKNVCTTQVSATQTTAGSQVDPGLLGGRFREPRTGEEIVYRVRRLWGGLIISFVAGNLSGLLGIGGGVFKVPALNLMCEVPIKAAAATSNFMIGVTAAASAFLYFGRGQVEPKVSAAVVLGILLGSVVGSYLNTRLGGPFVKRLFAVLLLGVVAEMLYRAAS